jgi:hypothetical protein
MLTRRIGLTLLYILTTALVFETFRRVSDHTVRDAVFWVFLWFAGVGAPLGGAYRLKQAGTPWQLAVLPMMAGGLTLMMALTIIWRMHGL